MCLHIYNQCSHPNRASRTFNTTKMEFCGRERDLALDLLSILSDLARNNESENVWNSAYTEVRLLVSFIL